MPPSFNKQGSTMKHQFIDNYYDDLEGYHDTLQNMPDRSLLALYQYFKSVNEHPLQYDEHTRKKANAVWYMVAKRELLNLGA